MEASDGVSKTVDKVAKIADVGPADVVRAENSHRRHLTPAQRTVIAVRHTEMLEVGDVGTQKDGSSHGEPRTRAEVAKVVMVLQK